MATKKKSSKSSKPSAASLNKSSDAVMHFLQTEGVFHALQQLAEDPKKRQVAMKNAAAWLKASKLKPPPVSSALVSEDVSPTDPSKAAICLTLYVGTDSRWYCGRQCVKIPASQLKKQ